MKQKIIWFYKILLLVVLILLPSIRVDAVTLDNDGNARENPYGDSKIEKSYSDLDYYDCYVPYNLSPEKIGGYSTGVLAYTYETYNYSMKSHYPDRIANKFSYLVNGYQPMGSPYRGCNIESENGMQVLVDKNGNKYYMMAIQEFFYCFPGIKEDASFPKWGSQNGQLVDVILTDGTVIHFVIVDANDSAHTNGGPKEESLWNVQYEFSKLKINQYKHLFHAAYGNMIELAGVSWGAGVSEFMEKYNMSLDGNQVAYYRMYNGYIDDLPKRNNGIGKETSFNLGNVSISGGTSGNDSDNTGTSEIVSEWELTGMKGLDKKLKDNQSEVILPTNSDLSIKEQYSVALSGENIALEKYSSYIDIVRVIVVFIGLCLVLLGVFLIVALIFDKANNFIEISLVNIVTFGLLKYSDEKNTKRDSGYASATKIIIIVAVVMTIGLLLISGSVLPFTMKAIEWVVNLFIGGKNG